MREQERSTCNFTKMGTNIWCHTESQYPDEILIRKTYSYDFISFLSYLCAKALSLEYFKSLFRTVFSFIYKRFDILLLSAG